MSDALLLIYADALDDFERTRIASENRARALRQAKHMEDTPEERQMLAIADTFRDMEHRVTLRLKATLREHPYYGWVEENLGVGEKQAARLFAAIGDPRTRENPGKLLQYCGHGDPERSKRRRGQQCEHNPRAKVRVRLIAESCIKQDRSPFRPVYDNAKMAAQGKTHSGVCRNTVRPVAGAPKGSNGCGTGAHPEWGEPGSLWRPGHIHGHSLRLVGKEILKDLWAYAQAA